MSKQRIKVINDTIYFDGSEIARLNEPTNSSRRNEFMNMIENADEQRTALLHAADENEIQSLRRPAPKKPKPWYKKSLFNIAVDTIRKA